MVDIVALLHCLRPHVTATTVRQLSRIIVAMVAMTGRVTMGGIARWAGKGGSYRTTQRFFATVIPWGILFWAFFRRHVHFQVTSTSSQAMKSSSPKPGSARMAWIVSLRACTASQCPGWPSSPCLS